MIGLLFAGSACFAGALVAFGAGRPLRRKSHALAQRSPVALRSPFMRRGSLTHQAHVATQTGIDYRFGLKMGRLLQTAVPVENLPAIALQDMTEAEKRGMVADLIERGGKLRAVETNHRGRGDRDKPATPSGPAKVNNWRGEVEDLLDAQFPSQAGRVQRLELLTPDSTTAQALYVIDEAMKPLHNYRSQIATP